MRAFLSWSLIVSMTWLMCGLTAMVRADLVAHWPLDESSGLMAHDIRGQDGTLINFTDDDTQWVAGQFGGALQFDESDQFVQITNYSGILGSQDRTVSFWVKVQASFPIFLGEFDVIQWGNDQPGELFKVSHPTLFVLDFNGRSYSSHFGMLADQWQHVTIVVSGDSQARTTTLASYRSGELIDQAVWSDYLLDTTSGGNVRIGYNGPGSSSGISVLFDDIRIYDHALTNDQVRLVFENRVPLLQAGNDETITISPTATSVSYRLKGRYVDRDFSDDPSALIRWEQISGPGTIQFDPSEQGLTPLIQLPGPGDYRLKLTIDDEDYFAEDEVILTVIPDPDDLGAGTSEDPFLIYTAEQFYEIGIDPDKWDKHFALMADLDLQGFDGILDRPALYSIGVFTGTFEGNNHIIKNVINPISSFNDTHYPLFRQIQGAEAWVRNLTLENVKIDAGDTVRNRGGFVQSLVDGMIENCHIRGGVLKGFEEVGGLASASNGTIINCSVDLDIDAPLDSGGFIDRNDGVIVGCVSSVNFVAGSSCGGFARSNAGVIMNCYFEGEIRGFSDNASFIWQNFGEIINCYSSVLNDNSI